MENVYSATMMPTRAMKNGPIQSVIRPQTNKSMCNKGGPIVVEEPSSCPYENSSSLTNIRRTNPESIQFGNCRI